MTTQFTIRTAREDDAAALRRVWQAAFDDTDDAVAAFYKSWRKNSLTIAADSAGELVSAGYLLPVGTFMEKPCAMIYAVGTLPEYRGRGLAAKVTQELIATALNTGYPAVIVCPAVDSLFDYYRNATDFRDGFYIREYGITGSELPRGEGFMTGLSANDYMNLRGDFLRDTAYVKQNLRVWEYQSELCSMHGGGLYRIVLPDSSGCAVIERTGDDTVAVKELLIARKSEKAALSVIAASFDAREYTVRTPVTDACKDTCVVRFGMLALSDEMPNFSGAAYFGIAFD